MLDHWPLTGRAEEFGVIAELLVSEEYRGIALAGRPGVGKSRLAREAVLGAAESGWTVRHVAATATGRSVPLGAFAQWTDDFDGAPLALARRVIGALTDGADPSRLLVFVDDAHLLDELSALVLHQLVLQRAAVVVVTIRSGQPAPDAVTALWKDGLLRRLELQPLSRSESGKLLCSALELPPDEDCADRMWRLTQGNVLFLRQLVEQERGAGRLVDEQGRCRWLGRSEVSASLIELVEHQIGAVPEEVRDVVDLVAVGEPVDRNCLASLVDPMALEQAEQRELIRTSGDAICVGHPMYAEVRLNQCGPLRLRRLRGLIASAMKDGTGMADAVRRGLLWLESDLSPDAQVLASAATAASSLLDFALAERLSRAAAEAGVDVGARVHLAYNLLMQRKGEDAAEVIDSITADEVPASAFINAVILRAANLLWTLRAPEESWRVIDEALEGATGVRIHQLAAFRANQLALAARPAEVIEVMSTVDYGVLDGFGATIGLCAETLALGELGQPRQAVARATACYQVVDTSEQSSFLGQPLVEFHTFALTVSGHLGEAVEVAEAHLRRSMEKPATAQALAASIVGMAALAAGDLITALQRLPVQSASAGADFVLANSFYRFQLLRAQALVRSGDVEAGDAALRIARQYRHPAYVYVESTGLLAEAWVAAARERSSDARQLAWRAAEFTRNHGQLAREVLCLQTAVQFGDTSAKTRLAELATLVQGPRASLAARYASALGCDDAYRLEQVSADFESMGDLLAAADAAGQSAVSHRRAGRRGSALTAGSRAERLAVACGGATSPAIVAARLAVPFTQREREVALLVAKGLTNREIAEAVSLSVRTVEGHIYRASCKAGVAQRSELATMMRQQSTTKLPA
jgi:DNA-binding CsgD family transcriptional regulator